MATRSRGAAAAAIEGSARSCCALLVLSLSASGAGAEVSTAAVRRRCSSSRRRPASSWSSTRARKLAVNLFERVGGLHAGYEADIVSGATESLKGGRLSPVDIVSSATHFNDTRHQFTGGFTREPASTPALRQLHARYARATTTRTLSRYKPAPASCRKTPS